MVTREIERINGIVQERLGLTCPSARERQTVVIFFTGTETTEIYTPQIETRRITVGREYARDVPAVSADADLLYRAFVNLVANALEAMDPGGRLTVRAGWHHGPDPFSAVSRAGLARRLRIEIEDTGSGISALDADKVFDPFFTTKASGTGRVSPSPTRRRGPRRHQSGAPDGATFRSYPRCERANRGARA